MAAYDHKRVEKKWQKRWKKDKAFKTPTLHSRSVKKGKGKMYVLDMFPYPSGDGLHVGHVKIYTASDIFARYQRMRGYDVLHPTGWDAFGLPAENSAIKFGVHPAELTKRNIVRFREQMQAMGLSYDWEREVNTTDPDYYKWTQWIFLQLFKRGLAYEATIPINWCPKDKTGIANEEVVDGKCERCGTPVEQRPMRQWILKITDYADRLLEDLQGLDWPGFILEMQKNWIGRKEGINITYAVQGTDDTVTCFTTRPDTNFGATFLVIAPEHPFAQKVAKENQEVADYLEKTTHKTELDRQAEGRVKTGAFTGYSAVNQLTGKEMPIWVSDFVLGHFGTGAVMGVPGHDKRDFEFAQTMKLPVLRVVVALDGDTSPVERIEQVQEEEGTMINSDFLDGLPIQEAIEKMKDYLEEKGWGKRVVSYSLKDWVFSRQRYWGEPIPIIHCEKCGVVSVPEKDLPVKLPEVEHYEPTGTGESPLANILEWVNVKCPNCEGPARRETNTMPQWAGSSWYYLRYVDPKNEKKLVDSEKEKAWMPVDVYIGGAEHAVLHLLYARFWHKVLYDVGVVSTKEPFTQLRNVGLVMGSDGQKMSKSRGNVVNPDGEVEKYGADATRVFSMFMGPFDNTAAWTTEGIQGAHRFVKRVWKGFERLLRNPSQPPFIKGGEKISPLDKGDLGDLQVKLHQTIQRVTESTERFGFNVSVAAFMEFLNELEKQESVDKKTLETFVLLMAPYAPHLAEELWEKLGHKKSLVKESWPEVDEKILKSAQVNIPVQVNGKVRAVLTVEPGKEQSEVETLARADENVTKYLVSGSVRKVIYVPDKLLNFVVG